MWILIFSSVAEAQQRTVVSGIVSDSASGAPIQDAIVYFASSTIGVSTGQDGEFRFSGLRPGSYTLVISRVGYATRTVPITTIGRDSLHLRIELAPREAMVGEVNILGDRIDRPDLPPIHLFPGDGEHAFCAYGPETSRPIGILFVGQTIYMYSLEPTVVDSSKFLRLWLLVYNGSDSVLAFHGGRDLSLRVHKPGMDEVEVAPQLLDVSLPEAQDSILRRIASETIGKTMKIMGTQREIIAEAIRRFEGGKNAWIGRAAPPERIGGVNPGHLWNVYRESLAAGILRTYSIYPHNGVHGFVFFPFPALEWRARSSSFREAWESTYRLVLRTTEGMRSIDFAAH
jgi:hypothetical protein